MISMISLDKLPLGSRGYIVQIREKNTKEINKMAANVGLGRNMAGVHWRSDDEQSFLFGEEFAIKMLRDRKLSYNVAENYSGFVLTKFDGTKITI